MLKLFIFSCIVLLLSIIMSLKTGEIEYAWIIGSILLGIGSVGDIIKNKFKK